MIEKNRLSGFRKSASQKSVPSEHEEQCLFVQWVRRTFPSVRIFAIPNGGSKLLSVPAPAEGGGSFFPGAFLIFLFLRGGFLLR